MEPHVVAPRPNTPATPAERASAHDVSSDLLAVALPPLSDRTFDPIVQIERSGVEKSSPIAVTLVTQSLELQTVKRRDTEEIFQHLWSDSEVLSRYQAGIAPGRSYLESMIGMWEARADRGDPFEALTIRSLVSGEVIGILSTGQADEPGTSELSYMIRRDMWRKGFGYEAVSAVTNTLYPRLRELGHTIIDEVVHTVTAATSITNAPSQALLKKAGFLPVENDSSTSVGSCKFSLRLGERNER